MKLFLSMFLCLSQGEIFCLRGIYTFFQYYSFGKSLMKTWFNLSGAQRRNLMKLCHHWVSEFDEKDDALNGKVSLTWQIINVTNQFQGFLTFCNINPLIRKIENGACGQVRLDMRIKNNAYQCKLYCSAVK